MGLELEGYRDAEVSAAAPQRPEQVGLALCAHSDECAVGGDDVDSHERIDG